MSKWTLPVAALILALGLACAAAQKRVALVLGNDAYQHVTPLRKAGNDADRVARTLKGLGFQVISARDQNRRAMSDKLLAFERALSTGDTAFFFFAGHGFQKRRIDDESAILAHGGKATAAAHAAGAGALERIVAADPRGNR